MVKNTNKSIDAFFSSHSRWKPLETFYRSKTAAQLNKVRSGCLYELHNLCGGSFFVYVHKLTNYLLLLGPVLTEPQTVLELRNHLRKYALSVEETEKWVTYSRDLPVVPFQALHRLTCILAHRFFNEFGTLPYYRVEFLPSGSVVPHVTSEETEGLSKMRRVESRYELSGALTEAVKQGNLSLATHLLVELSSNKEDVLASRNENPLRNRQNYCIVLNTQLRYALEESGIHPYRLDRFSNEVAITIEKLKSIEEVDRFIYDTIRRYCELVQEHAYPKLKPIIQLTVEYIKSHLEETITVSETAAQLGVNADYLSSLFRKEMGISFIDFLNRERIQQAAELLTRTDWQIQRIATAVGYNNPSYFTKQFKKVFGQSPMEYRRKI